MSLSLCCALVWISMLNQRKNNAWFFAVILLGLFLTGLTGQSLHQFNNKARVSPDCSATDQHFHQNPDNHHCDLCDYQLASFPVFQVTFLSPRWIINYNCFTTPQLTLERCLHCSNRAPPAA